MESISKFCFGLKLLWPTSIPFLSLSFSPVSLQTCELLFSPARGWPCTTAGGSFLSSSLFYCLSLVSLRLPAVMSTPWSYWWTQDFGSVATEMDLREPGSVW